MAEEDQESIYYGFILETFDEMSSFMDRMLAMLEEGSGSVKVKIILEWILGVMNRDRSRLQGFLDEEFASDPTFKDQIIDAAGDASVRIDLVSDLLTVLEGQRALDGASD